MGDETSFISLFIGVFVFSFWLFAFFVWLILIYFVVCCLEGSEFCLYD